ncbi:unnamed protein product [Closterium sp. Naga37s-1]|nr:unnamed protein product [Closterium sp. Naga37s-1]
MASFGAFLTAFLAAGLLGTLVLAPFSDLSHAPLKESPSEHGVITVDATRKSPSEHGGAIMPGAAIRRITELLTSSRVREQQRCLDELQRLRKWREELGADAAATASSAAQSYPSTSPAASATSAAAATRRGTEELQVLSSSSSSLRAATRSLLSLDERRHKEFSISSGSGSSRGGVGSSNSRRRSMQSHLDGPPAATTTTAAATMSAAAAELASVRRRLHRDGMQRHLDAPPPAATRAAAAAAGEPASVRRMLSHTYRTPNLNPNAACAENETSVAALRAHLAAKAVQLRATQVQIEEMQRTVGRVNYQKFLLDYALSETTVDWNDRLLPPQRMEDARRAIASCTANGVVVTSKKLQLWKAYACDASDDDIYSFLEYDPNRLCPDDWLATQALIFTHNCFALPKRRCMARTNQLWTEPLPFPAALFTQSALKDENVRWSLHSCKSFTCLNTRVVGDCRNCFNLTLEKNRWQRGFRGSLPIPVVIKMKRGSLRLGLDAGGGTGTFAAHMALYNVTCLTTAMNVEAVAGRTGGLPYMETLAHRGLIPLWLPHKARLPLFDNTLDLVHCVNSIKYLPVLEFEELIFEWDRVLRVGGVMWFEMFYAPLDEMPLYIAIIEQLQYKKLHWNITPKPDSGERKGMHVYLNCVIEKPVRRDR